MKPKTGALLLVTVVLLAACGSSRRAASEGRVPLSPLAGGEQEGSRSEETSPTGGPWGASTPTSALVLRLDSLLTAEDTLLGQTHLGLHIVDLTTRQELYAVNPQHRMRPASTEKVVTAIAALDLLGPSYTLDTQLLTTAAVNGHTLKGDLYIKGVMDPLLSVADVRELAAQLKAAGITRVQGRLLADASFKDKDELGWGWCWDDENPTLSPLLCGGKPGLTSTLRTALSRAGITVTGVTATGVAPATARSLAAIRRPLTAVLQPMMKESDNLCAEAVFYQMGNTRKQIAPTITNVIAAALSEKQLVTPLSPPVGGELEGSPSEETPPAGGPRGASLSTIADGSGLSLYNYQTPATFTALLSYAAARPDSILHPLLEALPIAAVDGTLKNRMADTEAAQNVRAKTGSVSAVSTLVGYTTQRSTGHLIAFAILNNGVRRMAEGRTLQDKICVILSQ